MGENHSLRDTYAAAAADLPAGDPSYAAWRGSARGFLDPANQTTGGTVTATIESSMDGGQNNIEARAVLPATATTTQLNVMADTIERTIWLSQVDPLGRIGLIVRREGGTEPVLQRLYQDEIDTRPLGVKYGPRPNGLPG